MIKRLRHYVEYVLIQAAMAIFAALPLDTASRLGGRIGRYIGPLTGIDRKARRQMAAVFSAFTPAQIDTYITAMWDNLGRIIAEYPHLLFIMQNRLTLDNQSGLTPDDIRDRGAIFISGHFANWEVAGPSLLHFTGEALNLVYRPANNKYVDRILHHYRSMAGRLPTIPKSHRGARAIYDVVAGGGKVGILIDQKYSAGIVAPFFGRPAKSTTIYAQLAQKFDVPVLPAQMVREQTPDGSVRFSIILHPPLQLREADGRPRPLADVVTDAHDLMFDWVRANPGQWLWVHQRWSSPGL